MQPADVVEEVRQSGLRGRGGAGFPTGVKWGIVRQARRPVQVRDLQRRRRRPGGLHGPHAHGIVPLPDHRGHVHRGLRGGRRRRPSSTCGRNTPLRSSGCARRWTACAGASLFGSLAPGHPLELEFDVFEGAGAFVCGEETALLESIEGRRGIPRLRPPYPAQSGLFGRPTLINNVETYANLPWIFRNGAAAFAQHGTAKSKGTKVFALAGKTVRGGLIEVPMGITIRQRRRGHRRRHRRRPPLQGRPDRRALRRLPARVVDRHAHRLRVAGGKGRDHGFRRAGRAGRRRLHGGHRQVFSQLLPARVVRALHLLLRRHADGCRTSSNGSRKATGRPATWRNSNGSAAWSSRPASAGWARRPPTP